MRTASSSHFVSCGGGFRAKDADVCASVYHTHTAIDNLSREALGAKLLAISPPNILNILQASRSISRALILEPNTTSTLATAWVSCPMIRSTCDWPCAAGTEGLIGYVATTERQFSWACVLRSRCATLLTTARRAHCRATVTGYTVCRVDLPPWLLHQEHATFCCTDAVPKRFVGALDPHTE